MSRRTLVIAEAGVNHNGEIGLAKKLIDVASDSGADVVKFQSFLADNLVTLNAPKAAYQMEEGAESESHYEMLRRLELSVGMHKELIAHCEHRGIEFCSTGFDIGSVDMLADLGVSRFKIPSGEINNLPYLRHIGKLGGSVILSTGMSTLGEIEAAIAVLEQSGTPRSHVVVLHCTTSYPTQMTDVNLLAMKAIGSALGVSVGYSDHTLGNEVSIAAVALGACVIEKHFTLSRDLPGPDHRASLEPQELESMIMAIRNIEVALGDGIKRPTASELDNRPLARRSIVASRDIQPGEMLTPDNVAVKRPGFGLSPMRWDEIIGSRASRAYSCDEMIEP